MILNDPIYGRSEVKDSVLVELINSKPVQRLKGVAQHGALLAGRIDYSRYTHSVGVMLLLRRFCADLEEQIAGLLHDVSHTAFSHVVDWVVGSQEDASYQDRTLSAIINGPEIKGILARQGFDANGISQLEEEGRYPLLERKIPDLCADRIDYTLRDIIEWMQLHSDIRPFLESLVVHDSEFMFSSRELAKDFGVCYMRCENESWSSPESMLRYYLLSKALREAIDKNVIKMEDLFENEKKIIGMIESSGSTEAKRNLKLAFGKLRFEISPSGDILLRQKSRYLDPKFIENGKVRRLGDVDEEFRNMIDEKRSGKVEFRVRILE